MEEIILEKDLYNLSLDCQTLSYTPCNTIGLQMRRNNIMVKDTHHNQSQEFNGKSDIQSNITKKKNYKETVKINKEIVKIKDSIADLNLRNEINNKLNNDTRHKRTRNIKRELPHDAHLIKEDSAKVKHNTMTECFESKYDNDLRNRESSTNNEIILNSTSIFKEIYDNIDEKESLIDNVFMKENYVATDKSKSENSIKPMEDLQSLLIMMAISSKESDEPNNPPETSTPCNAPKEASLDDFILVSSAVNKEENMNFLNIVPLRTAKSQDSFIRKYVNKWKSYINNKRNNFAQIRKSSINMFFDKLEKKKINGSTNQNKAKFLVRDYNTYQHRYKVQKHVIALQKAKLEEQNRLIEELKYNKIVEASKHSVDAMRDEVRKTYFEIDRHLKPKIKCLTNELKMHDIEEPSLILHCLKVPQFLQRMEKRAREREEKHAIIRERRRQIEEERLRLKQQAELDKAEMDKEERIKRIRDLREKRKKEKIENIRKKQHTERMRALKVMADLHYEKRLILKCGLWPWMKLLQMKKDNVEKAKALYIFQIKKNVFLHWMWHTEDMNFDRNYRAEEFHRRKMLRKVFEGLKQNHQSLVLKKQVADDYYAIYLLQLAFRKLKEVILILKQENEMKLVKAEAYYNSNLLFRAFTLWRTLPALNSLKREQDLRKMRWRQKVLQVVPDYSPPDD